MKFVIYFILIGFELSRNQIRNSKFENIRNKTFIFKSNLYMFLIDFSFRFSTNSSKSFTNSSIKICWKTIGNSDTGRLVDSASIYQHFNATSQTGGRGRGEFWTKNWFQSKFLKTYVTCDTSQKINIVRNFQSSFKKLYVRRIMQNPMWLIVSSGILLHVSASLIKFLSFSSQQDLHFDFTRWLRWKMNLGKRMCRTFNDRWLFNVKNTFKDINGEKIIIELL